MSYHYYLIDWFSMECFDLGNYAPLPNEEFEPRNHFDFDDHLDKETIDIIYYMWQKSPDRPDMAEWRKKIVDRLYTWGTGRRVQMVGEDWDYCAPGSYIITLSHFTQTGMIYNERDGTGI